MFYLYIKTSFLSILGLGKIWIKSRAPLSSRQFSNISLLVFKRKYFYSYRVFIESVMNCGASKIPSLRKQSLIIFSIFFHPIQHQPPLLFWISHNTCHSSLCSDHLRKPYFCTSSSHQKQARCRPHQRFQRCGLRLRFPRKCGVKSWHTGPLL